GDRPPPLPECGKPLACEPRHPARHAPLVLGIRRPEARREARLLDPHHPEVCARAGRERDQRERPGGSRQRGPREREHEPGVERVARAAVGPRPPQRATGRASALTGWRPTTTSRASFHFGSGYAPRTTFAIPTAAFSSPVW